MNRRNFLVWNQNAALVLEMCSAIVIDNDLFSVVYYFVIDSVANVDMPAAVCIHVLYLTL